MKTKLTLLTSLLILTQVMQAHPTGHDKGFLETTSHLFTQFAHSHWLAIVAGIATVAYCLRLAVTNE
ncbi:MAG: hypothetical protein VXY17_00555 [Verrucomicrobiota bacterium]|nr:hypothetical protein [Verrucomicrobiota bacterium]MEC8613877.1 hypothetical protein [Verrucomicrobiota bacterium]